MRWSFENDDSPVLNMIKAFHAKTANIHFTSLKFSIVDNFSRGDTVMKVVQGLVLGLK